MMSFKHVLRITIIVGIMHVRTLEHNADRFI